MIRCSMKPKIAAVVVAFAFVCGVAVGDWQPGIAKALKVWLRSLPAPLFEKESPYYRSKVFLFRELPGTVDVVMLGDSITEGVDWHEFFLGVKILNRGISGDSFESPS
jgi:hypothetical protein